MEKRLIFALMISIVVVFVWTTFVVKPPKRESPPLQPPTPVPEAWAREAVETAPPSVAAPQALVEEELPPEEIVYIESDEMRVELSDVGGTVRKVVLKRSGVVKKESYDLVEETLPEFRPFALSKSARLKYAAGEATARSVTYKVCTENGLEITKRIGFSDEPYVITMDLALRNASGEFLPVGEIDAVCGTVFGLKTGRYASLGVDYFTGEKVKRLKEGRLKKLKGAIGSEPAEASWVAAKNSFFALVMIPEVPSRRVFYGTYPVPADAPRSSAMSGLGMQLPEIAPDREVAYSFRLYAGPKDYDLLKSMEPPLGDVMGFGFFGPLSKIILASLKFFYGICGNYGVAIILLTIAIRIVLFPLNQKSFKSMKKMQDLAPLLEPLKEKYKKDAKKLQAETMALYKKHGVNPMSGCFPMLLQMPILIAFFQTLRSSVMLWGAHFLWIKDLSEPDAIYTLQQSLPIIGNNINLLPILMLVVFVLQQKMSPAGMGGGGAQAAQQQKMMSTMMPIIFGVLFYNMPSGLVLYFTVSTLLGILQQWLVRRGTTGPPLPVKKH
ncbi:MAG: membrane protein insertase YidC [Candidatus Tritonobacter lacicola]|nr:membrane protein insertase YidC [Candidatus Tritonobacter lacicola]